ncbi:hypothetical protein BH09MYX1_BH09MYX1_50070 [soil metagenome]
MSEAQKKAEVPYKRPSIPGWLFPLVVSPFVVAYGAVAGYAYLGPMPGYVPRTAFLVVGLAVATLWAPIFALIQGLIDLLLLAVRMRTLENGVRAWGRGFVAAALPIASYMAYSPHKWWKLGPWSVAIAMLIPMVISALVVRVFFGRRP